MNHDHSHQLNQIRLSRQQNKTGRSVLVSKGLKAVAITAVLLFTLLFVNSQRTAVHALNVANLDNLTSALVTTENNQITSTGQIGNFVWLDENGNGLQDPGEPGVADVTVTLYDAATNTELATTTTDATGFYSFTDLEGGEYLIGYTLPAQRSFTAGDADGEGINGIINSDVVTQTGSIGFTNPFQLGANETNMNVDAGLLPSCYSLDWAELGYEPGNSLLQTFTNVAGSSVNMTVEVRLFDADFNDIGPYVSPANQSHPLVQVQGLFSVRDIDANEYPEAGMVVTIITFPDPISANELGFEPFFFYTQENIRKEMAVQSFDSEGNGIVPGNFDVYGGSNLVVEQHPTNSETWLRSDFPNSQTNWSGAFNINYGTQPIQEIHWYSWAKISDGQNFSHVISSSYLTGFSFCQLTPTAVSLIDLQSSNLPALPWAATLVALVFMTGLLLVVRRREEVTG
jgi:hypothetical protein